MISSDGAVEMLEMMRAEDAHAEALTEHHHLALGEAPVGHGEIDRFAGEPLELHDGTAAEAEDVLHRHPRPTELDRQRKRQVHQHGERHFCVAGDSGAKLREV